jgi:pimeloyl-ACP methyl ester carboxylesterase
MEQRLIMRGFASGALGGLLAFVFARILAVPVIERAIDYENGRDAAEEALRGGAGLATVGYHHELFSRGVQGNAGLPVGVILFGVAMGGLVAVAYALVARGMDPCPRPRVVALLIAAAGFAGFFLLPFLKYPAAPPGIEQVQSIQTRGGLYLVMVAVSVVSVIAAGLAARRLAPRLGGWRATLVALVGLAVWVAIVAAILPAVEPSQPLRDASGAVAYPRFPSNLLFQFRLSAIGVQVVLWTTVGLAFGVLVERLTATAPRGADLAARHERTADALIS